MVFNWLLTPQIHKQRNGYYINHDNLISATPEDRKKLIFYFIACQTPEKLDPVDHKVFNHQKLVYLDSKQFIFSGLIGGYTIAKLAQMHLITSRVFSRPILNFTLLASAALFSLSFSWNIGHMIFEPVFVAQNKKLDELSVKYNFSVFDFAQAKKEAHLKLLVNDLVGENQITSF